MNTEEFLEHLINLSEEDYDSLVKERIARLNPEQQAIAQAREVTRKERQKMVDKLSDSNTYEEDHEMIFNALRDTTDRCEHGRPYVKHCIACAEIDHLMFPELFDEDGNPLEIGPEYDH